MLKKCEDDLQWILFKFINNNIIRKNFQIGRAFTYWCRLLKYLPLKMFLAETFGLYPIAFPPILLPSPPHKIRARKTKTADPFFLALKVSIAHLLQQCKGKPSVKYIYLPLVVEKTHMKRSYSSLSFFFFSLSLPSPFPWVSCCFLPSYTIMLLRMCDFYTSSGH